MTNLSYNLLNNGEMSLILNNKKEQKMLGLTLTNSSESNDNDAKQYYMTQ